MDIDELLRKYGESVDRLSDTVGSADVFERQFGSELAAWEKELHEQFRERLTSRTSCYRGFVRYTQDPYIILLTPSPWLLEGVFVYIGENMSYPQDGARIEVTGFNGIIPRLLETEQTTMRAIIAQNIETLEHSISSIISSPPKLSELSRMIFENVGMAEASKRVFSQLYVSSPPILERIGGLTAGIQAIASQKQVNRLFRFMKGILPPSLKSSRKSVMVRGIRVDTPRIWRMEAGSVSRKKMEDLCLGRRDTSGYSEVSMAALTESSTATLPDVPIALANEDFWVETKNASELQLPVLKSAITFQLLTPQVSQKSIDSAFLHIQERIDVLRSSFGLDEGSISRGSILDANELGRPLSAIKLARSSARAYWKEKVTAKDLKSSWDKVLEPALREFIEISEIKGLSEKQWGERTRLDRYNTKVVRALQKLDTGKRGSLGPTLSEVAEEAGLEQHKAALTLTQMKDDGLVYEPKNGHFRLV
ncbi:MAG: hypothetical protein ACFFEF_15905 [Candidatus Thorarchaeota archaeon]